MKKVLGTAVMGLLLAVVTAGWAVTIDTVSVGDMGNAADTTSYGAVSYAYNIGKYEVTAGQYTEFLNAVAKTDTYGLYSTFMDTANNSYGCNIKRTGSSGSYAYSVANNSTDGYWANRPVNFVSYWDSCRFANWLGNGQGNGSTETGAYTLTTGGMNNNTVTRNSNWKWAVTSEDEWYKAAYYSGSGSTYYDYPTGSNSVPSNVLGNPTDPGNNATYWNNGYTIGSPYYRTEVGAHENSDSPYGTFDQGGNVWEWNEAILSGSSRGLRGGSFFGNDFNLHASTRNYFSSPTSESGSFGFRVSEVPEPASLALLALGGIGVLVRRRGVGR